MLRQDRSAAAILALRKEMATLDAFVPDPLRIDWMADAWSLQDRHGISFWDSLLVAAAMAGGCSIFLSEDMNGRQTIGTITIVNPFATSPEAVLGTD
jgi:predicted nucleic acid-binding protein